MSKQQFTFISAPMDGVIDSPMRQMIRKFSKKELLFGEMRHVSCVAYEKSNRSLRHNPIEHPLAFQVSANSTKDIEIAVPKIVEHGFVELNLNCGCPAKNVIKSGSGSALMAQPKLLEEILLTLRRELNGALPLTIKIRAGFKKHNLVPEKNGITIAKIAQDCGVEALTIHPRTQPQGFSGELDYEMARTLQETLSIPVAFSGDICSFADAQATYEKTGITRFMIGRALWGCPWKMHEITCEAEGKPFTISHNEVITYALQHLDLCVAHYGPVGLQPFKSHLARYVKGFDNAATLRRDLLRILTYEEMSSNLKALIHDGEKI